MTQPVTMGVHHVGLAVPDLDAAARFFVDVLGFSKAGEVPDYPALFVSDGAILITLWQVADPATATAFDRRTNVGLHHLAFKVADDAALDALHDAFRVSEGCVVEVSPCPIRAGSNVRHFIGAMPGGIRIEFATPFGG
jgi:catechol 2,3-dioxygenase-like lactoylglutathione lyase family enzyme